MQALLRLRLLPLTSYGYQPPPEATAHGWRCANYDCGAAVRRWRRCRLCGWPADPEFDEPWAHEALGVQLSWQVSNYPERGAGIPRERLLEWRLKDALLRHDDRAAAAARAAMRDYADEQRTSWWNPGSMLRLAVFDALDLGDLHGAAEDLCFWLEVSGGAPVEDSWGAGWAEIGHSALANAKPLMDAVIAFLAAPGGEAHPRAPEIRKGALRVAGGCLRAVG